MKPIRLGAALLTTFLAFSPGAAREQQPAIEFGAQTVIARNLTPGGQAIWFGFYKWSGVPYPIHYITWRSSTIEADGTSRFDVPQIPAGYVEAAARDWYVADVSTGRSVGWQIETANEFTVDETWLLGDPASPTGVRVPGGERYWNMTLFRPGVGAWKYRVGDGSPWDDDGEYNFEIKVTLANFEPIDGEEPAPARLQVGDELHAFDDGRYGFFTLRIGVEPPAPTPTPTAAPTPRIPPLRRRANRIG